MSVEIGCQGETCRKVAVASGSGNGGGRGRQAFSNVWDRGCNSPYPRGGLMPTHVERPSWLGV